MADRPVDERSPLIERTDEDSEAVREVEEGAVAPTPVPEKKRTWWQIMWNAVLALLAIFVAVVFIKGFIDADDVEVRLRLHSSCPGLAFPVHLATPASRDARLPPLWFSERPQWVLDFVACTCGLLSLVEHALLPVMLRVCDDGPRLRRTLSLQSSFSG